MPRLDPPIHSRFPKGKSGNPKGRTPITETQKQLKEVIVAYLNETDSRKKSNLRKLLEKLSKVRNEKGARLLLEYGFGKVQQTVDVTSKGEQIGADAEQTNRAISTLADAIREAVPGAGDGKDSKVVSAK